MSEEEFQQQKKFLEEQYALNSDERILEILEHFVDMRERTKMKQGSNK